MRPESGDGAALRERAMRWPMRRYTRKRASARGVGATCPGPKEAGCRWGACELEGAASDDWATVGPAQPRRTEEAGLGSGAPDRP
eukprot:13689572-Alexandrium_andersonii.AAC.1